MFRALMEKDHIEVDELYFEALRMLDEGDRETALQRLDVFWARLAVHIRAEHLHIFPAILALTGSAGDESKKGLSDLAEVIAGLRRDHNDFMFELARAIKLLRSLRADDPRTADFFARVRASLRMMREQLVNHNRIEEEKIYPLEKILAEAPGNEELTPSVMRELANLPPRFTSRAAFP